MLMHIGDKVSLHARLLTCHLRASARPYHMVQLLARRCLLQIADFQGPAVAEYSTRPENSGLQLVLHSRPLLPAYPKQRWTRHCLTPMIGASDLVGSRWSRLAKILVACADTEPLSAREVEPYGSIAAENK